MHNQGSIPIKTEAEGNKTKQNIERVREKKMQKLEGLLDFLQNFSKEIFALPHNRLLVHPTEQKP